METTLESPAVEHVDAIEEPVSDEIIAGIRQTLTWMTEYLLPRQIGYADNPPPHTPLLTIPTAEEVPVLRGVQSALSAYLSQLPTESTMRTDSLRDLHQEALGAVSDTMGHISHYYWQILSWNKNFSALNSQENAGQDAIDAT